ncbi:MAG: hypothetical protein AB7P76_12280 [Candidatus Melainabacteria bacterium]
MRFPTPLKQTGFAQRDLMDVFEIIQSFFTQMHCQFCDQHFEPDDIRLLRHDHEMYVVNVFCHHCDTQNGVALVGVQTREMSEEGLAAFLEGHNLELHPGYEDPELTPAERERLAKFDTIREDDVLDAHHFFSGLDASWIRFIPEELRQCHTAPETESQPD